MTTKRTLIALMDATTGDDLEDATVAIRAAVNGYQCATVIVAVGMFLVELIADNFPKQKPREIVVALVKALHESMPPDLSVN